MYAAHIVNIFNVPSKIKIREEARLEVPYFGNSSIPLTSRCQKLLLLLLYICTCIRYMLNWTLFFARPFFTHCNLCFFLEKSLYPYCRLPKNVPYASKSYALFGIAYY